MRLFALLCGLFTTALSFAGTTPANTPTDRPKVLFFDVNETLLDLATMRESVGQALGKH